MERPCKTEEKIAPPFLVIRAYIRIDLECGGLDTAFESQCDVERTAIFLKPTSHCGLTSGHKTPTFCVMKTPKLHPVIAGLLLSTTIHALATDPAPPHMTVELRDGSRIVCQSLDKNFRFRSALSGEIDLPVQDIQLVDCSSTNSVTVIFAGCTNLLFSFADSNLHVMTAFGKVNLPVSCIVKVTVAAQPIQMRARVFQPGSQPIYDYPDPAGRVPHGRFMFP